MPQLLQEFDYSTIASGFYDEIYSRDKGVRSYWHRRFFRDLEKLIAPGPEMTLLDVGCAAGSLLASIEKPYKHALGIDISPSQIAYANKKYGRANLEFVTGDIRTYSFDGRTFDTIVMNQVIEHISRKESVEILHKLRTLLNPGGKLILTTPNYASLWPVIEYLVNRVTPHSYEHQHINKFDARRMREILKETGFQVADLSYLFFLGFYFSAISRRLADRLVDWESRYLSPLGMMMIAVCRADEAV